MTQPDQNDQLLLDAAKATAEATASSFADTSPVDSTKLKEKIIQVVVSGKSKRFLGKLYTTQDIEQLDDENTKKLFARYEAGQYRAHPPVTSWIP